MTNLKVLMNTTSAGKIAKLLDSMDNGGSDGQIEASIWNAFVADKGGKTISNSISIEDALKSITTYAVREGHKLGESTSNVAKNWINNIGSTMTNVKDNNPPSALDSKYTAQNISNANKTITDPTTKQKIRYNSEGYVDWIVDEYGCTIFERDTSELINYGLNGHNNIIVKYNLNGEVIEYTRYKEIANKSKSQTYNPDGSLKSYSETEFDGSGHVLKETVYNPDGTVQSRR